MVGSAIVRRLGEENCEVLTASHKELDLTRQAQTEDWLARNRPDAVFVAAATVGGIYANDTRPAEFIYNNLLIESNLIDGSYKAGVEKLLFLGSSCIYPRMAPQPMAEDALLTGPLEPTNQWYALAKIAGIKLCSAYRQQYGCNFISAMPTNLYGPFDNFDLEASHVIPALMAKIHAARQAGDEKVSIWGTGTPRREFLYVDDLADALVFLMKTYADEAHVNVGTGVDVTISELAQTIAGVIGYDGGFDFDTSKPDGAPRKLLNVDRLAAMGWEAETTLTQGLTKAYAWYLENEAPS